MFTDINNFLFEPSKCMTSTYSVGIIEVKADSSFLVHHFLSYYLKEKCSVVLVSFCQSFNHFNSVGNKIGNNLVLAKDNKQFKFIEGLKWLAQAVNTNSIKGDNPWTSCVQDGGMISSLPLYELLKTSLEKFKTETEGKIVLIIDSLSTLVDVGVPVKEVIGLLRYLNVFLKQTLEGSLLIGLNNDLGEEDEEGDLLKKFVKHSVDLCLEVCGLETGYCKDVHGQLSATWYSTTDRERPMNRVSQFKLTDKTCSVFASGMSSAVL